MANTLDVSSEVKAVEAIRPFQVDIPQADLDDLQRRILAARWPEKETVSDNSQGIRLATMQALAEYWATSYDWRKLEARLNAWPQFITTIDGLDIHFIHVRSKHKHALPLLIAHGWPGSIIEQLKIIDPLVDPTAYGGTLEDAFDVVIPSMPGYGFSEKPATTGWSPDRIASAWITLMKRLGYTAYVTQGGDWGSLVTEQMAVQAPPEMIGMHTNMPAAVPADIDKAAQSGAPPPSGLSADEKRAYEQLEFLYKNIYYAHYMRSRPQTLVALSDSPIALAAFMIDPLSLELITSTILGQNEDVTRDDVIDRITFPWFTNTAISSARLYSENKLPYFTAKGITIPVAVSVFPDELYQAPRSWAEQAYPNLIHYNNIPAGGHFAAWEQPKFFSEELRTAFRPLRSHMPNN
jgi:pimeloyl-ACP methyl ester carboxylesterase